MHYRFHSLFYNYPKHYSISKTIGARPDPNQYDWEPKEEN